MSATLADLRAQLHAGQTTSLQLTREALTRAEAPDGEGPRVFLELYADTALSVARRLDELRATGVVLSPLMGIPVSIKDLFDVAGEVTRAGSLVLRDAPPAREDAAIVARLKAAGAVLIGRTNMVEFAYSGLGLNPHYGTPSNPWQRAAKLIPGGSSSGAAVSVTDGMCAAAIGTDTGGSVRIPAALCGLTGFKPTAARIDARGTLPLSPSLDSIGPLAATVSCCSLMDCILAGTTPRVLAAPTLSGLRFLVPDKVLTEGLDDAVATAWRETLALLRDSGAILDEMRVPEIDQWNSLLGARAGIAASEAWNWHKSLLARHRDLYDRRVAERIEAAATNTAADYSGWLLERRGFMRAMQARMTPYAALLAPTVACSAMPIAPLIADEAHYRRSNALVLRNTSLINFLDGCSISLPCHRPGSAPVGLMLSHCGGADERLLNVALAVETCLDGRN